MKQLLSILFFCPIFIFGQKKVAGKVVSSGDVEGIHVFNQTLQIYTITNTNGAFEIPMRINDTITFSAIKYELKKVILTKENINDAFLEVLLTEKTNQLDEVHIGLKLTGNLEKDIKSIKTVTPIELSKTDSFRGLGEDKEVRPSGVKTIKNETLSSFEGTDILGLVNVMRSLFPEKEKVYISKVTPLQYTRSTLVVYYGNDFFKNQLNISKTDEERFILFSEFDVKIEAALIKRNKFELLNRIIELRAQFILSK